MTRTLVASIVVSSAVALFAAAINPSPGAGLAVHEWGTFTSIAGPDGSGTTWNSLVCKDDLPTFVNNSGSRNRKFALMGNVRMETPVLYFYSARELEAAVKVSFVDGEITEWYPNAAPAPSDHIEWRNIKVQPGAEPSLPLESLPSRYYAARVTDSAPLAVNGQHEKFLFYRGVGRIDVPLNARIAADGKITVANAAPDPVPVVILFENRGGRIGFRNLGALEKSVTLDPLALDQSGRQLTSELENALVDQGLYPKEAQAMLATWQDSWFEEGSRLIYIVPQSTLARVLPLQVDPAPAETTRVFVGRIELITSETKRAVESAMTSGDRVALAPYARFLDPILKRIASEDPAKRNLDATAACQ